MNYRTINFLYLVLYIDQTLQFIVILIHVFIFHCLYTETKAFLLMIMNT